jgi:chemotaxis protein MotB
MRTVKLSVLLCLVVSVLLVGGCNKELKDLRVRNDIQAEKIRELRAELDATKMKLSQAQAKLDAAEERGDVEVEALKQQIAALEADLEAKKELIAAMQDKLLAGGTALPPELSTQIEDFAKANPDLVSFDAEKGLIKFKSDLLFEKGSDVVTPDAATAVKSLCAILNSDEGKKFDIIVAGHTDDIPIERPTTKEKHPTNWHLSAHRGISVLNTMTAAEVAPERLSVRGFGEYRPVEANEPDKKGNPANRRVEIYIVPQGT